jgi:hypothetical protein
LDALLCHAPASQDERWKRFLAHMPSNSSRNWSLTLGAAYPGRERVTRAPPRPKEPSR